GVRDTQRIGLPMQQTGPGYEEQDDPSEPWADSQTRVKEFCSTETEQDRRQEIRRRSDELIANPRDNCAHWSDEILRRMVRRRNMAEPNPGRHILRRIGNQRKKQQSPRKQ